MRPLRRSCGGDVGGSDRWPSPWPRCFIAPATGCRCGDTGTNQRHERAEEAASVIRMLFKPIWVACQHDEKEAYGRKPMRDRCEAS